MKTTATQIRWAKRPLWHRGKVGIGVIDLQPMHSPGPTVKPDSGFMLFHDPLDILGVSKAKKAGQHSTPNGAFPLVNWHEVIRQVLPGRPISRACSKIQTCT